MFVLVLFINDTDQKQLKVYQQENGKLWYIYIMEYNSAIKKQQI